jgi:hypothetical protein
MGDPGGPDPKPAGAVAVEHAVELEGGLREALAAVAAAAEAWGADWQPGVNGGRLVLPVLAGIRHGTVAGRVAVEPRSGGGSGGGSRVGFVPEETRYALNTSAVAILVLASLGGLLTVLWPFYPKLLAAAPLGAVIALSGWFLVVSRLRTSGPDDFLALVVESDGPDDGPTG